MEIENEPKSEFDDLLLSAVYQDDGNLLKNHLSTVVNPNLYFNRVYDEENDQRCTLLMIACLNDNEDIINMLLHHFKPNLEVLNDILYEDMNTSQQMFFNVSVLWLAAAINNFELVKLLVKHGANVNHTTKTRSTPLRCACYHGNVDMARYLIENGADINITKENNETNLKIATWHKRLEMVTYLVNELNCDVNECDNDGRSPLYDAVCSESFDLTEFLLKHGARNFRASLNQMSPLMWAAEKKRIDLMEAIHPHCSVLEWIEAEELLGSAFLCFQYDGRGLEQSFEHLYRAIELRMTNDLPKGLRSTTIEIFDNRQECHTLDQLDNIRSNYDAIYIEALLVRERLLGSMNEEYQDSLYYRGAVLADNDQHHRAFALWIYELRLRQQFAISLNPDRSRQIAAHFSDMIFKSFSIPIEALMTLITAINEELEHNKAFDDNLYTLLFLITISSQFLQTAVISAPERRSFYRLLRTITQHKYTTPGFGLSLLHLSLNNHTTEHDYHLDRVCKYPCLQTARILLQCGVDVNATDAVRNTPLHIFASNEFACDETILELLCNAGAHLDYVNALGETPIDLASNSITKQLLKNRMKLSLKCLCARLIQKNSVPFHGKIGTSLVLFIEKH